MKSINRSVLLILISMIVTVGYSQQQQRMSAEDRAKSTTEWMTKELKLDDKTSKKVEEINLKYAKKTQEKMMEARDAGLERSEMREMMGKVNDEKNKELKPILGDEKYEQYLKLIDERRQNRQAGQQGGR